LAPPDDQSRTQVMRAPVVPAGAGDEAVLVVLYGPSLGRRYLLGAREEILGRSAEATIALDAESVSRRHARVTWGDGEFELEDLGSTNGSFVNDRRIDRCRLANGDILRIGGVILKFLSGSDVEASYHEEIYRLTILDALTQVHNKRYFLEFLEREASRASRHETCLALVLFDIDHFKQVNDTHGHLAGDSVLKEIGRRLRPRIRKEDLLARYGGEEFACVLPDTTKAGAGIFAEALRILVERYPVKHASVEIPVTISLGVAVTEGPLAYSAVDLIKRADERLYDAKRGGRNRTSI
jgi:two-component system cell cycle response regulator